MNSQISLEIQSQRFFSDRFAQYILQEEYSFTKSIC